MSVSLELSARPSKDFMAAHSAALPDPPPRSPARQLFADAIAARDADRAKARSAEVAELEEAADVACMTLDEARTALSQAIAAQRLARIVRVREELAQIAVDAAQERFAEASTAYESARRARDQVLDAAREASESLRHRRLVEAAHQAKRQVFAEECGPALARIVRAGLEAQAILRAARGLAPSIPLTLSDAERWAIERRWSAALGALDRDADAPLPQLIGGAE